MADSPDPMREFRKQLSDLRNAVGASYGDLEKCAARLTNRALAKQTISDLLTGSAKSRWTTVETFILACQQFAKSRRRKVSDDAFNLKRWRVEFDQARRPKVHVNGGPLREPYRAPDTAETPVRLLRAEYAVVPFQNRDELTVLREWCQQVTEGDLTGVAVVHGVGGAGKTRLALELAHRLSGDGWYAGVLPKDANAASLASVTEPVLIVVDYADGRVTEVIALLKTLRERAGPPAVVVLTARSIDGQWLTDIVGSLDDDRHAYRREAIRLPDEHPDSGNIYLRTVSALDQEGKSSPALPMPALDVRWTTLDFVLLGWITARGAAALPTTQQMLYDEVLRHEENYWCTVYARFVTNSEPERALLRKAAAVVSLVAPPNQEIDAVLSVINDLNDDARERRAVRRTLQTCLNPAPGEGLAVRPDPICDHLILDELGRNPALLHTSLAEVGTDQLGMALAVLNRAGQADVDAAISLITAIADADHGRWPTILAIAAERAGPALTVLEQLVVRSDSPLPLDDVSAALPFSTVALFDLALAVDQHRLMKARAAGAPTPVLAELLESVSIRAACAGDHALSLTSLAEAVDLYQELADDNPTAYLPNLAALSMELGNQFAAMGRHTEALGANQQAANLHRSLIETDPDTFLPSLAMSLSNLGNRLREHGRRDEALATSVEAVDIYRTLAATSTPVTNAYGHAGALTNLSHVQSALGRHEEALVANQEAVDLFRQVAAVNMAAFAPSLAQSLSSLGAMQFKLNRYEQGLSSSQEAVALNRRLAAANPAAHLSSLAISLNNLGLMLLKLGDRQQALAYCQEAVALQRRLVAVNPAAAMPDLAGALANLGAVLLELDRHEEALAACEEAIRIRRTLAAEDPASCLPELAVSLNNLGSMLWELGQREQALAADREVVDLHRRLAATNPAVHLPNLAGSLTNLGTRMAGLGDHKGALAASQEAVDLYRELPVAHLSGLGISLTNLGLRLLERGDHESALVTSQEAVSLYRNLAATQPAAYIPDFAASLTTVGVLLSELGHHEEALDIDQEAVALYRTLVGISPAEFLPSLARSLINMASQYFALGYHQQALVASHEAVALSRQLSKNNSPTNLFKLAKSLGNLSVLLADLERSEEALATSQEAVDIYRTLAATPDGDMRTFATLLANLSARLAELGHHDQALVASQEALDLTRNLVADNPAAHMPDLARMLTNFGVLLADLEHHEPALTASQEAVKLYRGLAATAPVAHLPPLAASLKNLSNRLAQLGHREPALAASQEAVELYQSLAIIAPIVHLSSLVAALEDLSHQSTATGQEDSTAHVWHSVIDAMSCSEARSTVRAAWARSLATRGELEMASHQLQRAALEADCLPSGDGVDHEKWMILVRKARLAVRSAVRNTSLDLDGLPLWATAPVPESHVALVNTIGHSPDWPTAREALNSNRDILTTAAFATSLEVILALQPGDTMLDMIVQVLREIAQSGADAYFAQQEVLHTHRTLLEAWIGTNTWAESAEFYRQHKVALAADDCKSVLLNIDSGLAKQHLAILDLGATMGTDELFAIVADPSVAEEAALNAIEAGDLDRMATIAVAAARLQARPMSWALVKALLLLAEDELDHAVILCQQIAEHGNPMQRRAHAARLRALRRHRPQLTGVQELAAAIDLAPQDDHD